MQTTCCYLKLLYVLSKVINLLSVEKLISLQVAIYSKYTYYIKYMLYGDFGHW